jgi:glycosyltransferase involved in cell wall biosynthesis
VLFVIHTNRDERTAVYRITRQCAAYIEQQGKTCSIVTPEDVPWARTAGARFLPLLFPIAVAVWLFRHGKKEHVAIFHSYSGWVVIALARIVPRFRQLRTVIQFHGLEPLYFRRLNEESRRLERPLSLRYRLVNGSLMLKLIRYACRRADMVFCLNQEEFRFLRDNCWAEPSRIQILGNPVPSAFFVSRQYRVRATRILFVGQWLSMKGIRYLAQAFARLHDDNPDLELVCAGTLVKVERALSDFPDEVRAHVSVTPRLGEAELIQLQADCDIFVLPTLSEGFSLALIEAAAAGMPIVTTPVGAAPDFLQHDHSVVFCPIHDSEALATAIADLLDDRPRRELLGRNAREVASRFRAELVWQEFERQLDELWKHQFRQSE